LCCVVLCCVVSCRVVLCCTVVCSPAVCCVVMCCNVLCYVTSFHQAKCSAFLFVLPAHRSAMEFARSDHREGQSGQYCSSRAVWGRDSQEYFGWMARWLQVPGALRNPWTKRARAFSTSATNDIYHNWSNRMCSRCLLAGAYVSVRSFSYRSYLNRPAELFTIARCLLIQVLLTLCIQPAPLCPQNTARGHD